MDMILHSSKRFLGVFLSAVTTTVSISGCQQDNANTAQQQTEPQQTAVAGSVAPTSLVAATPPATTTASTTTPIPPSSPASSSTSSSSATASSTKNYSLVSSNGQVIDANNLNQSNSVSYGSTGSGSRPELEGADTTLLTDTEIAVMQTKTTTARVILESIIGFDSRYQVNPTAYPERAVSLITYNGSTHCTGWLVSKDTLVTAGHCVHGGGISGKWGNTSAFKIYPGYSDGNKPYGSCNAKELYSSSGWISSASNTSDIGIIKLDCSIGNATGYFSYFVANPVDNTTVTINGYPGDKADAHQQWASNGTISHSSPAKLYYDNDTTGGMSGSPIWVSNNGTAWALGIHTTGESSIVYPGTNSGTRISQDIFDLITAAKELP